MGANPKVKARGTGHLAASSRLSFSASVLRKTTQNVSNQWGALQFWHERSGEVRLGSSRTQDQHRLRRTRESYPASPRARIGTTRRRAGQDEGKATWASAAGDGILQPVTDSSVTARSVVKANTDQGPWFAQEVDVQDAGNGCRYHGPRMDDGRVSTLPRTTVATGDDGGIREECVTREKTKG